MRRSQKSFLEIREGILQLASLLKEEDLDIPEIEAPLAQVLQVLDPSVQVLPQELVAELSAIRDKKERFLQAAMALQIQGEAGLKALAGSMKASGLLSKAELDRDLDSKKEQPKKERVFDDPWDRAKHEREDQDVEVENAYYEEDVEDQEAVRKALAHS